MTMLYLPLIDEKADQATFEQIYCNHRKEMLKTAFWILKNHHDAEDAVQNALLGLSVSIKSVPTDGDSMRAYALASARNAALRYKRQNAIWSHMASIDNTKSCAGSDVFEQIVAKEEYKTLLTMISQLPLAIKEAMILRYVTGMPPREIAKLLKRKSDTVRKQLFRGKKLLIEHYQEGKRND